MSFGCNTLSGIVLFYPHRLSECVCPSVCGSGRSFPSSLAVCRISLVLCCLALLGIVSLFDWEEYGFRACGRNSFTNSQGREVGDGRGGKGNNSLVQNNNPPRTQLQHFLLKYNMFVFKSCRKCRDSVAQAIAFLRHCYDAGADAAALG